jgi:hypothetical protein
MNRPFFIIPGIFNAGLVYICTVVLISIELYNRVFAETVFVKFPAQELAQELQKMTVFAENIFC